MAVKKDRVGGEKATGHKSGVQSHNTFGWTLAEVLDGGYLNIYVECQRKDSLEMGQWELWTYSGIRPSGRE